MWKVKCGKKFRLKYVKKVSCFNKAKIYYNDENDFTVVSRYTDSDCDSEDELVLEVVDISDNMNMTRDDLMKFTTDAVLQLNKDIEDGKNKMYGFMQDREIITKSTLQSREGEEE